MREAILKCAEKIAPNEKIILQVEEAGKTDPLYANVYDNIDSLVENIPVVEKSCEGVEVLKRYSLRTVTDVAAAIAELLYYGYDPFTIDNFQKFPMKFRDLFDKGEKFVIILLYVNRQKSAFTTKARATVEITVRKKED